MRSFTLFFSCYLVLMSCSTLLAQDQVTVDLLELFNPKQHQLRGEWSLQDDGIHSAEVQNGAIAVLPYELFGSYQLSYEFTRNEGQDVIGVILPLGSTQCLLELSGWAGLAHGLSRINQVGTRHPDNPASVKPGTLENEKRYRVEARVQFKESSDEVSIQVRLDEEPLFEWEGKKNQVVSNLALSIPNNQRIALATNKSNVTYHKIQVTHQTGQGKPVTIDLSGTNRPLTNPSTLSMTGNYQVPLSGGVIDLKRVNWTATTGTVNLINFQGEPVVQIRGNESVALIPRIIMKDGVIETEIASGIFSGIAFRAADEKNYDLIYFRPQNSGTAKHDKTVQYVCKGKPGADWRTLREQFPGQYESGADMKVNQWFRVKIEVKGNAARAYVGDSAEPVLEVNDLLGDESEGQIGIWGWATNFRNFRVTLNSE